MNARMIFVAMVGVLFVCVPALAEWTEPEPVSEINTAYNDKAPFLSFDGLTLYFNRSETDTFYYRRIYQATRPEPYGPFTSIEEISTLNYSGGHVSSPWVSPDNLRMYYCRNEPGPILPPPLPPPPLPTGPIWQLKVTERASIYDPWQPGVNISELNALGSVYDPSLTADELTIVFGGYSLQGHQGYHIWMAERLDRNSPFGNVRDLSEIYSAAGGEVAPYISPNGLVLYFISNRNGTGQAFKATRTSVFAPFGNLEQLSFLDSPGSSVGGLRLSSDGTAMYFNKKIYGQPWDAYVCYLIEPATLVGLEIVGPGEVAENFRASYKAIAHYDDDSTRDVTDLALWSVEPEATASIEAGVLTTKDIVNDQLVTIWASYTEGDVTVEAEKAIDILAICLTGTALSFDGVDDYVDCGDDSSLDSINSVSLWFKAQTKSNYDGVMINQYSTNADRWNFVIYDTATGLYLWSDGYYLLNSDANSVFPGNWYHAAITWDGSIGKMYINGIQQTETTTTSFFGVGNPKVLSIGINYFNSAPANSYFNGLIDDVRLYDRALSGEEIRANMHRRLGGDEPGLVGYWDFDEGQGQIVYDLSGNGNDGQLGSTPDVDESDPAWVESDAPIGYGTPYLIATAAAKEALKHKRASLKELEAALAKEWIMYEALEQWLESGDFGDLSKGDIVKARQSTHSAMQHEEQSIDALEKSIEKLLYSLSALGYGPQPPGSNWPPNVTITRPQNGAEFNPDQTIEIKADAWDYDGSVVSVEFFADGSKIGEDNGGADGWTTGWYEHPEGTYNITAKATDDDGAATTSAAVGIRVAAVPPPPPPPPRPPGAPWPPWSPPPVQW